MRHKIKPKHDLVHLDVRVYIEGVRVPFENISVTAQEGQFPSASVQIPFLPGLQNISRYYAPKIHIFYKDLDATVDQESKEDFRVLFTGIVVSTQFSKSTGAGGAHTSLSLNCMHKNMQMESISVSYAGRGPETITNPGEDAAATSLRWNSMLSFVEAFKGIKNSAHDANVTDTAGMPPTILPFYDRLQGIPGVFINYWNQLKHDARKVTDLGESMIDLYEPLVESNESLRFFHRASGHVELEREVNSSRVDLDSEEFKDNPRKVDTTQVIAPPTLRSFLKDGVGTYLAKILVQSQIGPSGEKTSFLKKIDDMAEIMEYRRLTLACPVQSEASAIETIWVPPLDFYYAPICNTILPNMYDSLQVVEDTFLQPTRVQYVQFLMDGGAGETPLQYRAPQALREAIAEAKGNVREGLILSYDQVAEHEYGRGIFPIQAQLPQWLMYLSDNKTPTADSEKLDQFKKAFSDRFKEKYPGGYPDRYNIFSSASGLNAYQTLLLNVLDYQYTKILASTRRGGLSCVFNPYIIPGYPMDIISDDEITPSYHARCASVTHNINGAGGASTSVSFESAVSYDEMYSYYLPPITPWIQDFFGLVSKASIVDNAEAAVKADAFYNSTLGIKAAKPEVLFDYERMKGAPVGRQGSDLVKFLSESASEDILDPTTGINVNMYRTATGNLSMIRREIETMADYERDFGVKFIDVDFELFMEGTKSITKSVQGAVLDGKQIEFGYSLFLDYPGYPDKKSDERSKS